MSTTVMSIKTDKQLKENAQRLAKDLGFPLGTLINAFLRQFVREEMVHFGMETTMPMSKTLEKILGGIEDDIKKGKNLSPKFDTIDEALNFLKNQPKK